MHPHPAAHPALASSSTPSAKKTKPPRSTLVSRNVTISGHRTSVRLEPDMWSGLTEICRRERANLHQICSRIASAKAANTSLTAAVRVHVMSYYRSAATEDGHGKAGHGTFHNQSFTGGYAAPPVRYAHSHPSQNSQQQSSPADLHVVPNTTPANTSSANNAPSPQPRPYVMGMGRINSGSVR